MLGLGGNEGSRIGCHEREISMMRRKIIDKLCVAANELQLSELL
jgi:hypothetical protein